MVRFVPSIFGPLRAVCVFIALAAVFTAPGFIDSAHAVGIVKPHGK